MTINETLSMLNPEEYSKYLHNMSVYNHCMYGDSRIISPEEVYARPSLGDLVEFEINKYN